MKSFLTLTRAFFAVGTLIGAVLSALHIWLFLDGDMSKNAGVPYLLLATLIAAYGYLFATNREWDFMDQESEG